MLLALRRGARAWPPFGRFLQEAAPDELRLTDDEALDLLGDATDALSAAGIAVHWPRELVKALTAQAVIGQSAAPGSAVGGLLDADQLLDFRWQLSIGGEPLTEDEMDALAETRRPLIRLRDQWVIADPKMVARAKRRRMQPLTPMEALTAALTGEAETGGETVACEATGALAELVARIREPESRTSVEQPGALTATLRDYQKRGLAWLAEMCDLGLGGCLADMTGDIVTLKAWRGRITLGDTGLQLRYGPDSRWYPYGREGGEWWPCTPADHDPVAALAAAWEKRPPIA
jgi:hypothetical protein